ncbi:tryptophan synthase subunit alpha [Mucilaginibacter ginkgonis]|uniref:Tryptophan synthase alpha chain n=1 Tax=Mucilaginibacter ginkgonis TaxID=2682091 RepID=A0A6I4HVV4_9SPHI|nr:tryptophan synthase subunit alpha [Mucilaginibacter ginkgonis]QQL51516.1 tryptophan synthase subunit alpha [Mucilaginibacter ginkgonis]
MNRLNQLFDTKKDNLLSVYFTAGYPELNSTLAIAEALEKAGVDFLEVGFPYSDPVADGPTIQHSSQMALDAGMNLNLIFEQLKDLRKSVTIPILLMGYANPVMQFGVENFCRRAAEVGVDGCIIPDLPMHEYEMLYKDVFARYNISNIFLVTPQTSEDRIRKIDELSNSFIYLLSSASITGKALQLNDHVDTYFARIQGMNLKNPTIVGFGIGDKASFTKACQYNRGAIVGSAFVKMLGEGSDYLSKVEGFVKGICE